MTHIIDMQKFDYVDAGSASEIREEIMKILEKTTKGEHKLTINLKMDESRIKLVFYDVDVSQMAYVDEFINHLLSFRKPREAFSHSRDHKVSMYYFLYKMHFHHRVRV